MKPNLLGVWLPIEIARLQTPAYGWPEGLEVIHVDLVVPGQGRLYRIECPDQARAMWDILASVAPATTPEGT